MNGQQTIDQVVSTLAYEVAERIRRLSMQAHVTPDELAESRRLVDSAGFLMAEARAMLSACEARCVRV